MRVQEFLDGASKPIRNSTLLPLDAPEITATPNSNKTRRKSAMAKRRRAESSTTPPPIAAVSNSLSDFGLSGSTTLNSRGGMPQAKPRKSQRTSICCNSELHCLVLGQLRTRNWLTQVDMCGCISSFGVIGVRQQLCAHLPASAWRYGAYLGPIMGSKWGNSQRTMSV